jgi:phosphoribosyl 1,2-cyclic phosphate phosphodiesterase
VECADGTNLLIDCGPDFYVQMLHMPRAIDIDALLVTHQHYDHVGGIDDLRPYCWKNEHFPVYCQADVERDLRQRIPYAFSENPYPGVPHFEFRRVEPFKAFTIGGVEIVPVPVNHYRLEIVGYRIGRSLAYITDAKFVPDATVEALKGIDTLVINALRLKEHISHMSLEQSLEVISRIGPRRAFLTHVSHDMPPVHESARLLPPNVSFAYDGLEIDIED